MNKIKDDHLYAEKIILAPMVRAGRTPLRMLALEYGADLVYTEEIVDHKLLSSDRIVNENLKTVDFISGDEVILRIASDEKSKCVLQIGTTSPENAVQICQKFDKDVAAIDLNMGCPKPFSVHAGMGAALLSNPLRVKEILTAMVSNSSIPISCKIRLLNSHEQSMEFVRMLERCGISAIGVHGRRRDERQNHKCRNEEIHDICRLISIPIIANGGSHDIRCHADIEKFRQKTGASSVMLARKAFTNPSIFRHDGLLEMEQEIQNFLEKACRFDENYTNTKYIVQRILGSQQEFDPRGRATVAAATVREICRIWGMEKTFLKCKQNSQPNIYERTEPEMHPTALKRAKFSNNEPIILILVDGVFTAGISFPPKRLKRGVAGQETPKCVLQKYCYERKLASPIYQSIKRLEDGRFTGTVCVNEKFFGSTIPQPNMKMAEQVAALVALYGLDIRHRLRNEWDD